MRVAVICPYGTNSLISHIVSTFALEGLDLYLWAIEQTLPEVAQWTRGVGHRPKAQVWNTLVQVLRDDDLVLFTDDDIEFPPGFVERYLELVQRYGVDMSSPALTQDSYYTLIDSIAWDGLSARRVNWVDQMILGASGRLLREVFPLPNWLGAASWGAEYFFADALITNKWSCAIFDELQVKHTFRPIGASYSQVRAFGTMLKAFADHSKLSIVRSQHVLKVYPANGPPQAPTLTLSTETQSFLDVARPMLKEPFLSLMQKAATWTLRDERQISFLKAAPAPCRSFLRMALFTLVRAQAAGRVGAAEMVEQVLSWRGSPFLIGRVINLRRGVEDWYRWMRNEPTLWHKGPSYAPPDRRNVW